MIPAPVDLGFPDKFKSWRPLQIRAIEDGIESKKRFVGQMGRPGTGKTGIYMAQAVIRKARTMVLTNTTGLQAQLEEDFDCIGLTSIMGKNRYDCNDNPSLKCDEGEIGKCLYKNGTNCTWYGKRDEAKNARLVTTNYTCWLATNRFGRGFGEFEFLILDECHSANIALANALQISISGRDADSLKVNWPLHRAKMESWKEWARECRGIAESKVQALKDRIEKTHEPSTSLIKDYKHFKNLSRNLQELASCHTEKWVCDRAEWNGYKFDPIDPSEYAEKFLFRNIPHVLLTSGTITPRTLQQLGIAEEEFDFFEYESPVKIGKSPLIYVPTAFITRNSDEDDMRKMVERIDEIVEMRPDRRGIIHTSNFKIRNYIKTHSRYSKYMISNYPENGDVTSSVVKRFKEMKPPAVLVTPSVSNGYDFIGDFCRYQIIAKLPFPDYFSSKVDQERGKLDPKRGIHDMWQTLAQQYGRGDRAEDDWCEVICIDNSIEKHMMVNNHLCPWWLSAVYKKLSEVPYPPDLD